MYSILQLANPDGGGRGGGGGGHDHVAPRVGLAEEVLVNLLRVGGVAHKMVPKLLVVREHLRLEPRVLAVPVHLDPLADERRARAPSLRALSLRLALTNQNWKVTLWGKNLTDDEGPSGTIGGNFVRWDRRSLGVMLEYTFD